MTHIKRISEIINEERIDPFKLNDVELLKYFWDVWSGFGTNKNGGLNSQNPKCLRLYNNVLVPRYGADNSYDIVDRLVGIDEYVCKLKNIHYVTNNTRNVIRDDVHKLIELNIDLILHDTEPGCLLDTKKIKTNI